MSTATSTGIDSNAVFEEIIGAGFEYEVKILPVSEISRICIGQ